MQLGTAKLFATRNRRFGPPPRLRAAPRRRSVALGDRSENAGSTRNSYRGCRCRSTQSINGSMRTIATKRIYQQLDLLLLAPCYLRSATTVSGECRRSVAAWTASDRTDDRPTLARLGRLSVNFGLLFLRHSRYPALHFLSPIS